MQPPPQSPFGEFIDYLTFQKRYSQHTILAYRNDLSAFFDYIALQYPELDVPGISPPIIRSWLASLKTGKCSARSINRKLSTLKAFFRYHLKKGAITVNPASPVTSLKVSRRLPAFVEQDAMSTLFSHVEFPDTWEGKTDRLLLGIFYQSGVRLSELINLRESHVDRGNGTIRIMGKGSKERIIPLGNALLQEIQAYVRAKEGFPGDPASPFLLVSEKGKKLYPKRVYQAVKKYLGSVTTSERKSPHVLRHTFATHLTNNGADINAVKELLGHASLASTQVYTHNSISRLREIYRQAHPKS